MHCRPARKRFFFLSHPVAGLPLRYKYCNISCVLHKGSRGGCKDGGSASSKQQGHCVSTPEPPGPGPGQTQWRTIGQHAASVPGTHGGHSTRTCTHTTLCTPYYQRNARTSLAAHILHIIWIVHGPYGFIQRIGNRNI